MPSPVLVPSPVPTAAPSVVATASPVPTASIQISLPKLRLPSLQPSRRLGNQVAVSAKRALRSVVSAQAHYNRPAKIATIAVLGLVILATGGSYAAHWQSQRSAVAAAHAVTAKALTARATPSFKPLVPADAASKTTHGTPQIAYDGTRNTYSFTDTVHGMPVVVSQQPIPGTFKDATDAVAKVASSLGAKESVQTSSSGTAYIASDSKANAQTVVFTKNQLLVFIQSPYVHTSTEWQAYIDALKT